MQWQKDLTIDLGYKVVEGRNELVEEKNNWLIINPEVQWIDGGCPDSDKGHQIIFNTFLLNFFQLINRLCEIPILIKYGH